MSTFREDLAFHQETFSPFPESPVALGVKGEGVRHPPSLRPEGCPGRGAVPPVTSVGVVRPGGAEKGSPRPRGAQASVQCLQTFS